MRFPDDYNVKRSDMEILYYILLASVIGVVESAIPKFLPFLRLGAANIVIMYLIFQKRYRLALVTTLMKTFIASLLFGRILTPVFPMGLTGAFFSWIVMLIFYKTSLFSVYGISISGAVIHNTAQLVVLSAFLGILPTGRLLASGILFGTLMGTVNGWVYGKISPMLGNAAGEQKP